MDKMGFEGPNLTNTLDRTHWGKTALDMAIDSNTHHKLEALDLVKQFTMLTRGNSTVDRFYGGRKPEYRTQKRERPEKDWKERASEDAPGTHDFDGNTGAWRRDDRRLQKPERGTSRARSQSRKR